MTIEPTIIAAMECSEIERSIDAYLDDEFDDRERAEAYGVDQVPAIAVEGARDYGLRFLGIPSGYEFTNLIDALVIASTGEPTLAEETKSTLRGLTTRVDIKVFSTPT